VGAWRGVSAVSATTFPPAPCVVTTVSVRMPWNCNRVQRGPLSVPCWGFEPGSGVIARQSCRAIHGHALRAVTVK